MVLSPYCRIICGEMGSAGPLMRLPEASKACLESLPLACALVANMLGKRSNILGLDFEDSLEGLEDKNVGLVGLR